MNTVPTPLMARSSSFSCSRYELEILVQRGGMSRSPAKVSVYEIVGRNPNRKEKGQRRLVVVVVLPCA